MKKYSANYAHSNHNFVIQNLDSSRVDNKYLPAICILQNILQRGAPTIMSTFLQGELGKLHKLDNFKDALPLISPELQEWKRVIRGNVEDNHFPAKKFFDELIPKYLEDYQYIQQLIIPEVGINDITQVSTKEFIAQQVDFFLPQAYLIIEIDGSHHDEKQDKSRDVHTAKYGLKTVRIKVSDLENENDTFINKIQEIKDRIDQALSHQEKRKDKNPSLISLNDYKKAFETEVDIHANSYKAIAVIRFQLLILELLKNGLLDFDSEWELSIFERDVSDFTKIAIDDLFIWFKNIFQLHKIDFTKPKYKVIKYNSIDELSSSESNIKIDFSILKRYTDESQECPDIYFVRTDYLDEYRYFKSGNSTNNLKFSSFKPYDNFTISTANLIDYKLSLRGENSDKKPLLFLLWDIFLQVDDSLDLNSLDFREGQLEIIVNALSRRDTIGLLPTGSGKSVCYQLSCILQPAVSFVVCPIKSLMYDQKADLDFSLFLRTNHITGDDDPEDRALKHNDLLKGKYLFVFISPERFQNKTFREYFSSVNKSFGFAYAVIDEVHCLSEWGHDFRTSYLNLSDTINKLCHDFKFIGLTATASTNVLKDIQIEFDIGQENVKTPPNYTRKELEFIVVDDRGDKEKVLLQYLEMLRENNAALTVNGSDTKCGIVFTPLVDKARSLLGCYPLSNLLSKHFDTEIGFFSGKTPKNSPFKDDQEFAIYKKQVQTDFKNNKIPLMVATKAFGMGINKGNIYYTFHYGIPMSMESLYQEAGRAGRDKTKFIDNSAKCYVLLSKSGNKESLNHLWDSFTPLSALKKNIPKTVGDVNTILFLLFGNSPIIKEEYAGIKKAHDLFSSPGSKSVKFKGKDIGCNKSQAEKIIYRLKQLGIVEDWTISNWSGGGEFEVDYSNFSEDSIRHSMLSNIQKYDSEFSFDEIVSNEKYKIYKKIFNLQKPNIDKYILLLLQWSYDNFAYNRRQSLKNIYENCYDFSDGIISSKDFKTRLENYFKFTKTSFSFQHIADDSKNPKEWFEVFYKTDKDGKITDKFITNKQQESHRDSLGRLLESYMHNTGLDMISGLLRLLLDDYDNADGRHRLESSLEQITRHSDKEQAYIIDNIIKIGRKCNLHNKDLLSESLYKFFPNKELLFRLADEIGDTFSTRVILDDASTRLKVINKEHYGRFEEIR